MYKCKNCGKEFENIKSYAGHMSRYSRKIKHIKITDKIHICKYCSKKFDSGPLLGNHIRLCKLNPFYQERIEKMRLAGIARKVSDSTKLKVSDGMKLAHKEGRAWNIGMSRWNNKSSYPEQFFMKVIENEFKDKNYIHEYSIGIYSLDFAWPEKKKDIEIDGDQHQRFEEYKKRDIRKDEFLLQNGWKILRIKWTDMFNNTKEEIKKCKIFIEGS